MNKNWTANALCKKALAILRNDAYAELADAYANFHRAIELDPNFARPYVGLLEFRVREDVEVPGVPPNRTEELRTIARQLERLAPNLAATHCAQSIIYWADWNFPAALRSAKEGTGVDPGYELGHAWSAWVFDCLGRPDDARKEGRKALDLAPSKTIVYRCMGNTEMVARRYTAAIQWLNQRHLLGTASFRAVFGHWLRLSSHERLHQRLALV